MVVKHGGRGPGHLSRWPKAASGASFDASVQPLYGSAQFPPENGMTTDTDHTGEFRLPGSQTAITGAGANALWYSNASVVAIVDPAHERIDALNHNLFVMGNFVGTTNSRTINLQYATGFNAVSGNRRTFVFVIFGESAASSAWVIRSSQIPSTSKGPFAVFAFNDGSDGYCHVYDIPTATWTDGSAVAKPAGFVGAPVLRSDLTIGGDTSYTFPKDNSAAPQNATQWRGAIGDILFANATLSKANVESIVNGANPVTTATGAGATTYLHIPLGDDGAGGIETSVTTSYSGLGSGLTQYGTILPGPSMRKQDASTYLTFDRSTWPAHISRPYGSSTSPVQISGKVAGLTGDMTVEVALNDGSGGYTFTVTPTVASGSWSAEFDLPVLTGRFSITVSMASDSSVKATTHAQFQAGPAINFWGQSELAGSLLASYSTYGLPAGINTAIGDTETVVFTEKGNGSVAPSAFFHMRAARFRPELIGDAAMQVANALRRTTSEPIMIVNQAVAGTSMKALMDDADSSRTWADALSHAALAFNRGDSDEYIATGHVIGGWEAFFGDSDADVMGEVYVPFLAGTTSSYVTTIDHYLRDGDFSANAPVVINPCNRKTNSAALAATDSNIEADQRDNMRNYTATLSYSVGPETTAHKMEGENAAGGIPTGSVTHAETGDFEGYIEMAEATAQAGLMAIGLGTYPGPVFFESIAAGSAADKVVVTLGDPRTNPGDGLSDPFSGYATGSNDNPYTYAMHVKKNGGDPGACFEANIDGGGWSKANVTSGEILNAATGEVELTLSSTPSTSVAIRYMPGSTGNYTSGTITQANFRAGALYFTGEEYASGEPNSGDDLADLGWLVAGSNQALTLVL